MNNRPSPTPPPTLRQRLIGPLVPAVPADPLGDALLDIYAMFGFASNARTEANAQPSTTPLKGTSDGQR